MMRWKCALRAAAAAALCGIASAQTPRDTRLPYLAIGADQTEADHVKGPIYKATGFGNTFLVTTDEGGVIIDASLRPNAARHKKLLGAVSAGPVKYVIATHGHGDHVGGLDAWLEGGATFVAQENIIEFLHYEERLRDFFIRRNSAQFGFNIRKEAPPERRGNFDAAIPDGVYFDDSYSFSLGGLTFEALHTPSETYDALMVWIPELKAAFTGDLYYDSFPNLYTLRGTKPRYALDYVQSIDRVLALEPELLLPSHGEPVRGKKKVRQTLERYRHAILYVHDAVVAGMNQGKDVATLMREIKLPAALDVGEGYGRVDWSVRGIYEGYAGWFDGDPATMYPDGSGDVAGDLVAMAGGAGAVAAAARARLDAGDAVGALRLAGAALSAEPESRAALEARLAALEALLAGSNNLNETGWLEHGIAETTHALEALGEVQ